MATQQNAELPSELRLALRRPQAAKALGVSERTLDKFVKDGRIRVARPTSHPVYPVTELERFLRETTFAAV